MNVNKAMNVMMDAVRNNPDLGAGHRWARGLVVTRLASTGLTTYQAERALAMLVEDGRLEAHPSGSHGEVFYRENLTPAPTLPECLQEDHLTTREDEEDRAEPWEKSDISPAARASYMRRNERGE